MKNLIILSIFITIIISSCSRKNTVPSTNPDTTIVNLQADLMIIQKENQLLGLDSLNQILRIDSLFKHYNITKEQFETSVNMYKKDINSWKEFHQAVKRRLEALQTRELQTPTL